MKRKQQKCGVGGGGKTVVIWCWLSKNNRNVVAVELEEKNRNVVAVELEGKQQKCGSVGGGAEVERKQLKCGGGGEWENIRNAVVEVMVVEGKTIEMWWWCC